MDVYKEWLGIPEGPRPPDHYELLRLKRFEDDTEKVRGNYKKLNTHVRKYATGQYSVQSQDLLNEIAKAMLCLTDPVRKRDYDESLGREFPAELDDFGRQPLLDVLCRQGHISRDQAREAEEFADRRGLSHRDAVVQMKVVPPDVAARALATQLGYSYLDLEDLIPEDDILDGVPRTLVKAHSFIPLFVDDGQLLIATVDQPEHELEDELRLRYDVPIRPVIAAPRAINQAIAQYFAPGMRDEAKAPAKAPAPEKGSGKKKPADKKQDAKAEKKAVVKKPAKEKAELTEEELRERKMYGVIFMCWSFLVPMAPQVIKSFSPSLAASIPLPLSINLVIAAVICGAVSFWVTQKYWK